MTFRNHTSQIFAAAGHKLAALVACLVLNSFFVRAQDSDAHIRINFKFDNAVLDASYMDNAASLETIDAFVASLQPGTAVEIATWSSPEGNYSYNLGLSRRRANSVANYLEANYPALKGSIRTVSYAESWEDLRLKVSADSRLSAAVRSRVLAIIDSNASPDAKEASLKELPQYKAIYGNYFRSLRYAEISLRIEKSPASVQIPANSQFSANDGNAVPVVYFPLSEQTYHGDYLGNDANFALICSMLEDPARVPSRIVIEGAASPEGPVSINDRLGRARANVLASMLRSRFPGLEIEIRAIGENWAGLRASISEGPAFQDSVKAELLSIIDSDATPARKEALLKAHSAWKTIETECLPFIRYARIGNIEYATAPTTEKIEETATEPAPVAIDTTEAISPADTLVTAPVDTVTTAPADTAAAVPAADTTGFIAAPAVPVKTSGRTMIAAVKTNLLYDAVTALNVEVEIPIGKRFSIMAEDVFPWWETGNKYCFQLWEMGVEGRYWLKPWDSKGVEKLRGFFAGPYVMSGKYDFQLNKSINYQGEAWSVGVTAGYAMPVGKKQRMNLEFSLSMGYMESQFRHYIPTDDYAKLIHDPSGDGTFYNIFKYPTKAKISLVVPLCIGKKEVSHE